MPRLVRRDGVFYFRMAVPKALVHMLRRAEVKTTLRTADRSVARVLARRLSEAFETLFGELVGMPDIPFDEIDRRVRAYMQTSLNTGLELARHMPSDRIDTNAEVIGLREDIKRLRSQLASQSYDPAVVSVARSLLNHPSSSNGFLLPETVQHASEGVARARVENARILAARLEGRHDEACLRDPLFHGLSLNTLPPLPGEAANEPAQVLTFKGLGDRYLANAEKAGNQAKTIGDYQRSLRLAYAVIGEDKPAASITAKDIMLLAEVIGTIPPNFAKLQSKSSLVEAAASNANGAKLGAATQEKLFRFVKSVLKWAESVELIPKQPGANVKLPAAKKISLKDARHPYSKDQLKAIFASPAFTGHKTASRRSDAGSILVRDGKFWIPWIGLYSGMRLGEIVQLLKSDMKQEDGIWFFDVSKADGEHKHIKTAASVRRVPVHKALIDGGFLEHVSKVKKGYRLFEDVAFGQDGYPSANFTKYWGRYGRAVGFWTGRTTFHSFRHNLIQAMKEAGVTKDVRREIVGHEGEDTHDDYGKGLPVTLLKQAIDKALYPVPKISL